MALVAAFRKLVLHVFIDTNVYLDFFSFAADDLNELQKLGVAIRDGHLCLWITEELRDEFRRNREARVAESLARLRELKPSKGEPQMARNLEEFDDFLAARREFEGQLNAVQERLTSEFAAQELAADKVLRGLMDSAEQITVTDEILEAARRRVETGRPPGKKGSIGDAINWECLLETCPQGEDLHVLTQDSDYISTMDPARVRSYLEAEWEAAKDSSVLLHRRISDFLRDNFPDIKVASEFEKELRVRSLVESPSFEETHRRIGRLADYSEFTEQQAQDLFEAALSNSQISWIAGDADVLQFFKRLFDSRWTQLDMETRTSVCEQFELEDPDVPF